MPYHMEKRGGTLAIVRTSVGHSNSEEMAKASIRARMGAEHGWKPTHKK